MIEEQIARDFYESNPSMSGKSLDELLDAPEEVTKLLAFYADWNIFDNSDAQDLAMAVNGDQEKAITVRQDVMTANHKLLVNVSEIVDAKRGIAGAYSYTNEQYGHDIHNDNLRGAV